MADDINIYHKYHNIRSLAEREIETALENVKELEIKISDLTLRLEMLENLNSDILADFNDLKEQFGLIDLGKSIT